MKTCRSKFDSYEGSWVGAKSGITDTELADVGVEAEDIEALRACRLVVASKPVRAILDPEEHTKLRCRVLWNPANGRTIKLPQAWLKKVKYPPDQSRRRVRYFS